MLFHIPFCKLYETVYKRYKSFYIPYKRVYERVYDPGNKKMAKNDVNYIILMKILPQKNDESDEKHAISGRETDIIFNVFQINA